MPQSILAQIKKRETACTWCCVYKKLYSATIKVSRTIIHHMPVLLASVALKRRLVFFVLPTLLKTQDINHCSLQRII